MIIFNGRGGVVLCLNKATQFSSEFILVLLASALDCGEIGNPRDILAIDSLS